jgi:hypothetical protein
VPDKRHGTQCEFAHFIPMPRYFFHVHHDRSVEDYEGEELPDRHAAWCEATITAGQILQGLDGISPPRGNGGW